MDIGAMGVYFFLFLSLYFEVFLIISFLEKRPAKKTSGLPNRYPSVTIIVPCWNKEKTLGSTVESLLGLTYPKEKLSILIVDDGSTYGTLIAAEAYAFDPQVTILSKQNEGSKFSALNFGLAHSESELFGCLDADSYVLPDALLEVVKKFESSEDIMAVTPAMKVHHPRTILELIQAVEYTFGIFYRKMFDNLGAISVLPGPFSFYRRQVFETIGKFREAHHTEDMEMAFRMHSHGLKMANAHTALVYTKVPTTLGGLVRQRTRWSRGFLENSRDYSYMYLNPRFGNLGLFALPVGLIGFLCGVYIATYALYTSVSGIFARGADIYVTGIFPTLHLPQLDWFFIDTSVVNFLIIAAIGFMMVGILLGQHIAQSQLAIKSFVLFFLFFGMLAPLWLARAIWDTLLRRERGWLT